VVGIARSRCRGIVCPQISQAPNVPREAEERRIDFCQGQPRPGLQRGLYLRDRVRARRSLVGQFDQLLEPKLALLTQLPTEPLHIDYGLAL
jgi:hypothetical protein